MKRYFTPEAELLRIIPKEDVLFLSLELATEETAPDVSYGDADKWEPANNG